jgi:hypothetical protein
MQGDRDLPEDWKPMIERHARGSPALQKLFPEFRAEPEPEEAEGEPTEEAD